MAIFSKSRLFPQPARLGEQILHVAVAQGEAKVEREAVIGGAPLTGRHRRATDRAVGAA